MSLYRHVPHPHIELRQQQGPVRVADQVKPERSNWYTRSNARIASWITAGVGSMTCAWLFAALALVSLPDAIRAGRPAVISWIAQTFLQLVLLSVIMVGQKILGRAADQRSELTFKDAEAVLAEALKIQEHLAAQDALLEKQQERLGALLLSTEKRRL